MILVRNNGVGLHRAGRSSRSRRQRGAVLIVGLVVLVVMTILGLSAIQTTALQERMAGNLRQNNIALQAAEAALQAGLAYIESRPLPPNADSSGTASVWTSCTVALSSNDQPADDACSRIDTVVTDWKDDTASLSEGKIYTDITALVNSSQADPLPNVMDQPRVYIEVRYVPPLDAEAAARGAGIHYYTVSALGFGASDSARAILQSTIAKVYRY